MTIGAGGASRFVAIALGLTTLLDVLLGICEITEKEAFPTRATGIGRAGTPIGVAPLPTGDAVVLVDTKSPAPEDGRELLLYSGSGAYRMLASTRLRFSFGERLARVGDHWIYSIAGVQDDGRVAEFIEGEGEATKSRVVTLPRGGRGRWLPLTSEQPVGLFVYIDGGQTRAALIGKHGVIRAWPLDPGDAVTGTYFGADELEDGTIIVVRRHAASSGSPRLVLQRLSTDGSVNTLADERSNVLRIAQAIDPKGLIALAIETSDHKLLFRLIDLHDGTIRVQSLLSGAGDDDRFPRAFPTAHGMAVGWVRSANLCAVHLSNENRNLLPATVGAIGSRNESAPFFSAAEIGDRLVFFWDRGDDLVARDLPRDLTGFSVYVAVREWICSAVDRVSASFRAYGSTLSRRT